MKLVFVEKFILLASRKALYRSYNDGKTYLQWKKLGYFA